jgi:hypothetical protein
MIKPAIILMSLFFSLSSVAKTKYLEVQVDIGACINIELLPRSSNHSKLWTLSAVSDEEGSLRIASGRNVIQAPVAKLKNHPGFFTGPLFDVVIALDDEKTGDIHIKITEDKRGFGRREKTRHLLSFDKNILSEKDVVQFGTDFQGSSNCMVVFK